MNTAPGEHSAFPRISRQTVEYYSSRGAVILLFSVVIGAIVIIRPFLPTKWGLLLVLGFMGFLGLMIIGNLKKVLLAIIIIDIPIRWDIYLGGGGQNSSLGMREGWLISATTFALIGLFAIYFIQEVLIKDHKIRLFLVENIPLVLYMFFTCVSATVAIDPTGSLYQIFLLAQMFALYVFISSSVSSESDVLYIMVIVLLGLVLEGFISVLQRFLGFNINIAGIVTVMSDGRTAGTLGSPNTAAGYFSLLLAPAFALYFAKTLRWIRYLAIIAFVLGAIGLVFTISRGGFIGFTISMIIVGLAIWFRGKIPPWAAFLILFVSSIVVTIVGGLSFEKIVGLRENAALARIPLMEMAWRMIQSHPIFGVGANNYALNIPFFLIGDMPGSFMYVVHNKYLLVWAETGLGGILSFVAFLGLAIWRGWKSYLRDIPLYSILSLGFAAAIAGQMTHMMVEIYDSRSEIQALWLVAGLVTAMERITRGGKTDEH